MKKAMIVCLFLSPFLITGCASQVSLSDNGVFQNVADNVVNAVKDVGSSTLSANLAIGGANLGWPNLNNEKDCVKHKGTWEAKCPGRIQTNCPKGCSLKFSDADKACGDSKECSSGYCLARFDGIDFTNSELIKDAVKNKKGRCQASYGDPAFQCGVWLTDGKTAGGVCAD